MHRAKLGDRAARWANCPAEGAGRPPWRQARDFSGASRGRHHLIEDGTRAARHAATGDRAKGGLGAGKMSARAPPPTDSCARRDRRGRESPPARAGAPWKNRTPRRVAARRVTAILVRTAIAHVLAGRGNRNGNSSMAMYVEHGNNRQYHEQLEESTMSRTPLGKAASSAGPAAAMT